MTMILNPGIVMTCTTLAQALAGTYIATQTYPDQDAALNAELVMFRRAIRHLMKSVDLAQCTNEYIATHAVNRSQMYVTAQGYTDPDEIFKERLNAFRKIIRSESKSYNDIATAIQP